MRERGYVTPMRVWLDDLRPAPEGWAHALTQAEAIGLLESGDVTAISLDHDLGEPEAEVGSGYGVACWIEAEAAEGELSARQEVPQFIPVYRRGLTALDATCVHRLPDRGPDVG
jgi:hypothetical protein